MYEGRRDATFILALKVLKVWAQKNIAKNMTCLHYIKTFNYA